MGNKIFKKVGSFFSFFLLLFIIVPFLKQNSKQKEEIDYTSVKLKEAIKKFDEEIGERTINELLNQDNLYENYIYNYAIKIPEGYNQNEGIGKSSNIQFYNEDLGLVVAIGVGKNNLMKKEKKLNNEESNSLMNYMFNKMKKDESAYKKVYEDILFERGYTNSKLVHYKTVNYNNRVFIKMEFDTYRVVEDEFIPISVVWFMTSFGYNFYNLMFTSHQWISSKEWSTEIQKSMSNFIISELITEKRK